MEILESIKELFGAGLSSTCGIPKQYVRYPKAVRAVSQSNTSRSHVGKLNIYFHAFLTSIMY